MIGGTGSPYFYLFKSVIEVLCYPLIYFFDARGKVGGVIAILLGCAMFLAGGWIFRVSFWGLGVVVVGIAYCGFGVSRFVGLQARMQKHYDEVVLPEPLSGEALDRAITTRALPFFVCTRCHIVMTPSECGGRCPSCGSDADCLPVSEEADRAVVKASVY